MHEKTKSWSFEGIPIVFDLTRFSGNFTDKDCSRFFRVLKSVFDSADKEGQSLIRRYLKKLTVKICDNANSLPFSDTYHIDLMNVRFRESNASDQKQLSFEITFDLPYPVLKKPSVVRIRLISIVFAMFFSDVSQVIKAKSLDTIFTDNSDIVTTFKHNSGSSENSLIEWLNTAITNVSSFFSILSHFSFSDAFSAADRQFTLQIKLLEYYSTKKYKNITKEEISSFFAVCTILSCWLFFAIYGSHDGMGMFKAKIKGAFKHRLPSRELEALFTKALPLIEEFKKNGALRLGRVITMFNLYKLCQS